MTILGARELARRFDSIASSATKREVLSVVGLVAVAEAKRLEAPHRKTGNLGRTIRLGPINDQAETVEIMAGGSANVGYAAYLEFGTKAHDIVPRTKKALAWGGKRTLSGRLASGSTPTMFARRVHHPGTRAYPYLVPGAKSALVKAGLADVVVKAWNEAA